MDPNKVINVTDEITVSHIPDACASTAQPMAISVTNSNRLRSEQRNGLTIAEIDLT